jgi:tetratricopeptide (TPR) repeat protein
VYSLVGLGRLLIATGKAPEAEQLLSEAVSIAARSLPGDNWELAYSRGVLGNALAHLQRYAEAESFLEAAHRILLEKRGAEDERTAELAQYLQEVRLKRRPKEP